MDARWHDHGRRHVQSWAASAGQRTLLRAVVAARLAAGLFALPQNNSGGFLAPGNAWWPGELGNPSSSGGQNDARYAYFPQPRRLAIQRNGQVTLYDTLDHQIGGVQQQQGGPYGSLSFSSQFGTFTVDSLPLVSPQQNQMQTPAPAPYVPQQQQQPLPQQNFAPPPSNASHSEILNSLERLAQLHQAGVLSEDEFRNKKADLLSRL